MLKKCPFCRQQQQQQHFIPPHNIQEIKIYNNSTDDDRGAGCEITSELKMPGSQLKEKMFKCLGQGHKNKENGETHTNS